MHTTTQQSITRIFVLWRVCISLVGYTDISFSQFTHPSWNIRQEHQFAATNPKRKENDIQRQKPTFRYHFQSYLRSESINWPEQFYNQPFWWNYRSLETISWRTDPTKATKAESMLTKTQQSITQILTIQRVCISLVRYTGIIHFSVRPPGFGGYDWLAPVDKEANMVPGTRG